MQRRDEISATLQAASQLDRHSKESVAPQQIVDRLNRLEEVLGKDNPTLTNLELSLHIDRIDCFADGRVEMRTNKLGALADVASMIQGSNTPRSAETAGNDEGTDEKATHQIEPRRRALLRTDDADDRGPELDAAAFLAADPKRFAGLPEQWFWTDTFRIPARTSLAAENSERVFRRRQESKMSQKQLAIEFEVSPPTIGAAIRHYLKTHPGERDMVELQRGGKRRPKFDLVKLGDEARPLWIDGWSKEKLADKFECSAPTIDKALRDKYKREGAIMPSQSELRQGKVAEARRLLDAGTSMEDIANSLVTSVNTVRTYLRESFAAEGKRMPDLRRRRGG